MKLIDPSYEILTKIDGIEELKHIEKVGRTCYKSEDKITEDGESAKKFVNMLIRNNHLAMIEFSNLAVKFTCSRAITHEIVRHRHFSFAQLSQRYVNYSKNKFGNEIGFIMPLWYNMFYNDDDISSQFVSSCAYAETTYMKLIESGLKAEEAREVLPNSTATELMVSGNYREWRHFFKLRTDSHAHPEMQRIARPLLDELKTKIPIVFDDITY